MLFSLGGGTFSVLAWSGRDGQLWNTRLGEVRGSFAEELETKFGSEGCPTNVLFGKVTDTQVLCCG